MSKVKYYYDPDTLSYRKIEAKKSRRYRNIGLFLLGSFLFGLLGLTILLNTNFINTPKELSLQRELRNYDLQFELLDKKMEQVEQVLANIEDRDNNIYRVYFEANPIPDEQRRAGFGGVNRYKSLEGFNNSEMIIASTKRMDIIQKQMVIQSKSLDEITKLAEEKEKLLAAIPAIQPINNEDLKRMASGYGWRSDPFTKARKMHWGMDFTSPKGTPIYATGDGKVIRADSNSSGYGNHIRIDHGFGYVSLYAHMSKYNVTAGKTVKRGDLIGFVGSTGRSEAPHLHYEVFKDDQRINPINFYYGSLTAEEFANMLRTASQENQSLD
ncbi:MULTISPECIES: M23 family metallopeptidase [Cellulophaga]|jgi:murein DD-endopeptidase MepM/ murein hydrolase activator NlpD|uniref:Peptidase family M23 n=2 Tax=Cellulophaga baltica TaxID=76594 RepID=A0A1G7GS99_9FLAO|nr:MULTISPECIES: M23 family metallopeptidase [Cellulophaga]WFO15555.1 M23 family metallopeptidase [Cellulophaga baltica 4]AIY12070.1 peptidase M23 [Cellulophaga baltica NN016038]AIZ40442.1 peptidase M23 [Cellulophaga baltica 18]KGK29833.1 peptidase M23 [Cellulophaga sp. E6(2014)]MBA6315146.1 M23 family metallopeptidase [Cellulophaga baltica]